MDIEARANQAEVQHADPVILDDWSIPPPPPRKWLVEGWIPAHRVTMIAGEGGTGKTRAAVMLAVGKAAGRKHWFAHESGPTLDGEAGPALFASWEDEPDEFQRRLHDWPELDGYRPQALEKRLGNRLAYVDMQGHGPLWGEDHALTWGGKWLRHQAKQRGAELLVLDSLAAVSTGNENDRAAVRAFVADWDGWAKANGCTVFLIAHPPKNTGAAYSGSTDWRNGPRALLVMEMEDGETVLRCDKSNYGPIPTPLILQDWKWWLACPKKDMDEDAEIDEAILACLRKKPLNKTEASRAVGKQRQLVSHRMDALLSQGRIAETIPGNRLTKYLPSDGLDGK